ncbi:Hsp20/alpha crystallin family protein [Chloroflexota bacterium]
MLPVRWEPGREMLRLERLVDRMMRPGFEPFRFWPALWDGRIRPALDVYETPEHLVVKATVPGIKPEDMEVKVAGDTLVIRGETKEEHNKEEERYLLRERRHGAFHRAVVLPEGLDIDKTEAVFEDGVLTVNLPKTEKAKAKNVEVKVKEASKAKKA